MKNRLLLGISALLMLSISGTAVQAQQVDVCKTDMTGPGLYIDTSAGYDGVDIKPGSPSIPAQVMQTADRAHIGVSELIAAAGKFGVNISAMKNVYFRGDLQLSALKWQSVKIISPQAIATIAALLLSHHLTLDLGGQQIEQCGGGNGRSILNGNLVFNGSIDIGQYSYTPYQQVIIQNTRRLSADSGGFIRIIGNNEGTLRVRHVLSNTGPIDLRNQTGTVTIMDEVQSKSNSVRVCGHCKS